MAAAESGADTARVRRNYTKAERDELIRGVTRRRESVPEAASKLGVSVSTAYGWVRAARTRRSEASTERPPESPTFVQLVPATARSASLVLRVRDIEIEVGVGFDAALLRSVIEVLQGGEA